MHGSKHGANGGLGRRATGQFAYGLDASEGQARMGFDVEILSVATANPRFRIRQDEVAQLAQTMRPDLKSMWSVYSHAGVETRYFCEPLDWCLAPHGWVERAESFQRNALDLFEKITLKAVASAGIALQDIDMIVTNTITGLAVPSLDAKLMHRLNLSQRIERLPIFGLGCGGGIGGLARATRLAQSMPNANVLFLTVDLCSLCTRLGDESPAMFVSGALFGDGAAAVLLRNTNGNGKSRTRNSRTRRIRAIGEWCWRDTEHVMGWDIKDDGFGVVLSPELPALIQAQLAPVHGSLRSPVSSEIVLSRREGNTGRMKTSARGVHDDRTCRWLQSCDGSAAHDLNARIRRGRKQCFIETKTRKAGGANRQVNDRKIDAANEAERIDFSRPQRPDIHAEICHESLRLDAEKFAANLVVGFSGFFQYHNAATIARKLKRASSPCRSASDDNIRKRRHASHHLPGSAMDCFTLHRVRQDM
jgi:alkylresorcinol/alkylpyrone synthase